MSIPISINTGGVYQNPATSLPQSTPNATENTPNIDRPVRQDTLLIGKTESNSQGAENMDNKQDAVLVNWTNQAASSIIKDNTAKQTATGQTSQVPNQTTENTTQTQPDWTSLSNWSPSGSNLDENVKQLSNRYQILWNFIDKNFSGEIREQFLFQLESLLSNKLESVIQDFSQPLYNFLEQNGQQNSAQSLILNIQDAVDNLLKQAHQDNKPSNFALAKLWSSADKSNMNVAKMKEFSAAASTKDLTNIKLSNSKMPQFSLSDIQKATKFVNEVHTTLESDNISNPKADASNQKANTNQPRMQNTVSTNNTRQTESTNIGLLSKEANGSKGSSDLNLSLLPLKTEAFIKHASLSPAMSNTVKAAVNTFLSNASNDGASSKSNNVLNLSRNVSEFSSSASQPDRKLVLLVGERIAEEYRKSGNIDKSLQAGVELVKNVYETHPEKQAELSTRPAKAFTFWEIIYFAKEKKDISLNGEGSLEKLKNNWNSFVSSMELNKNSESAGLYWNYYNSGMAAGLLQKQQHEYKPERPRFSLPSLFAAAWFIVAILLIFVRFIGVHIPSLVLGINLILALIFGLSVSFKLSPKSKDSDNVSH